VHKGGFSWKRAVGISRAKASFSRKIGIPLTKSGRQRKVGKAVMGGGCLPVVLMVFLMTALVLATAAFLFLR